MSLAKFDKISTKVSILTDDFSINPTNTCTIYGVSSVQFSCSVCLTLCDPMDCHTPLGVTGWISLQSKRLSRVFSNTTVQQHQIFGSQLSSAERRTTDISEYYPKI